jgi:cytochrome oxidase Cu insertion factor (SCO1/SenC/PrrC family)
MSDSRDENFPCGIGDPASRSAAPTSNLAAKVLLVNGLVACALVAAWATFGLRGDTASSWSGKATSNPFATATAVIDDDDAGDGKPKTITIKMRWPESGVAPFALVDRSGQTIRNEDLKGHPWVVSFIFTNCAGPCFRVSSAMQKLQKEFLPETDLRLVTITVDPERDTPDVLKKYADGFQADPKRWYFLTDPTGRKDKIYPLINNSFLMPAQEATGEMRAPGFEFIHTNNVLLVDEQGVVRGKWLSTDEAEFDQLRRELRKRLRKSGNDVSANKGLEEAATKSE